MTGREGDLDRSRALLALRDVIRVAHEEWFNNDEAMSLSTTMIDALLANRDVVLDAIHESCDHEDESATVMMCRKCGLVI